MLQRAIRIAAEAGASPLFVVLGAHREVIKDAFDFGTALIVGNDDWEEGIASSIRAGIRAVEKNAADAPGALLMICDQPRLTSGHLRGMLEMFESQPEAVLASSYAGVLGIPAIFPPGAYPDLLTLRGDKGARPLLAQPPWPLVSVPFEGGEIDIDRPEDLAELG